MNAAAPAGLAGRPNGGAPPGAVTFADRVNRLRAADLDDAQVAELLGAKRAEVRAVPKVEPPISVPVPTRRVVSQEAAMGGLPLQTAERGDAAPLGAFSERCRALWCEVIRVALSDAVGVSIAANDYRPRGIGDSRKQYLIDRARNWFQSAGRDFCLVYDYAGVDADWIRGHALAAIEAAKRQEAAA